MVRENVTLWVLHKHIQDVRLLGGTQEAVVRHS